jgi:hypothetical protein
MSGKVPGSWTHVQVWHTDIDDERLGSDARRHLDVGLRGTASGGYPQTTVQDSNIQGISVNSAD